ncbi:hypothetical protein PPSIR1_27998 [Plesiocystis pacifica SIR-1]|uniref:Phospholipid/glycerol acyltransferase domain-containing protein n=1 Tax=Plesiocystis pacifica SIR-1 TaxID=391625 RepID=A6FZM2_9BACT|nr:lysophospholipid acyltransferase family protein [Plesiocystis pacifica]EDM80828.1 hypothetical protein PPSIR1_27998 [Plesiocystis pacifica SIR-1]
MNRDFDGQPAESVNDGYTRRTERARGAKALFATTCLRMGGWKVGGPPPQIDKYVIIAAPHTTWWDGFWMLGFAWVWGIELNWMGKASLVNHPLGFIPRWAGVVPVDRSSPQGLVAQMVEQFEKRETILLAIPPEGTRAKRDYWKSGFYQIARGAKVPMCMSYLDYDKREAGFGPMIEPSGDLSADMDRIRAFYKKVWSRHPELYTEPRLREEDVVVKLDTSERSEVVDTDAPLAVGQ